MGLAGWKGTEAPQSTERNEIWLPKGLCKLPMGTSLEQSSQTHHHLTFFLAKQEGYALLILLGLGPDRPGEKS